ncbi:MAG: thioredoxin family protein [Candidatus Staskawiczbacteria bacterium]|nr:thioredoxin family protein [Candidatus Staskawiczbacteria bacterium]
MKIKILGTGCPKCKKLEANAVEALKQLGKNDEVVKITDIKEIMGYRVMSLPALVAGKKVLSYGIIPSVEDIKKMLANS